jgi:hypothetical protein
MAYPTVSAPYGFQAINRVDGMPYSGATRLIPIDSAYNTAIYAGDLVKIVTDRHNREVYWHYYWFPFGRLCRCSVRQFI